MTNKHLFPLTSGVHYLDTAAEGLPPLAAHEALEEYWHEKSRGTPGRERLFRKQAETEQAAASLLGTTPDNIALLGNSSEALNLLANSIDWRPGDEVLISDLEFPSNVIPWLRFKHNGVRLVVIPIQNGATRLTDWTSHLTSRTRVVSVSEVSYKTGTRIPFMRELAAETHRAGALFCVDATQALGRVPVEVEGADFLVASSYKWLLGTHGLAVVYISPATRESLRAGTAGWYSVDSIFHPDRFESFTQKGSAGQLQPGMPNFPGIFSLHAGISYLLSVGVKQIDDRLKPLICTLRDGLAEAGLQALTPAAAEFASGIVSFACDDAAEMAARLAEEKIIVWGGDGRIRISMHTYNDEDDVQACLAAIKARTHSVEMRMASSRQ